MILVTGRKKLGYFFILFSFLNVEVNAMPIVIGHRGASGYRPEHTIESYRLAIEQGADYIEPDLVSTKDHVLIARHENEISGTTNAAEVFPDKKTTKEIDGVKVTGWFTEDLTLKEIKQLKAKERLPYRDQKYNGQFDIPTLEEIINFVQKKEKELNKKIGIYIETKHPSYFKNINLPLEKKIVALLKKNKLNDKTSKIYIQSFEFSNLKDLKKMTNVNLVFLMGEKQEIPFDYQMKNIKMTYGELTTDNELKKLAVVVSGIGPYKRLILPENDKGELGPATDLVARAQKLGLKVHPYTFRSDQKNLHKSYNKDAMKEYIEFFKLNVDGVFSDFPDTAILARESYLKENQK